VILVQPIKIGEADKSVSIQCRRVSA